MLVRSGGLAETMSRYLIQRISENPAIELHFNTEIVSMDGTPIWSASTGSTRARGRPQLTRSTTYS